MVQNLNLSLVLIIIVTIPNTCHCKEFNRTCLGKPHIIFIVADDAGWNDFSFHGSSQIPTPNIDALAFSGIILNNYYASPLCTPTRGAIMTGKHPIHLKLQHYVIMGGSAGGLPLEEKLLPQYLKEFGYQNHLIGKWHLGHSRKAYTPTFRGFDSHYGYWIGVQDYYDHFALESKAWGYDFRSNMTVDYGAFGLYDTDLFTEEAVRIIRSHEKTKSLFLMLNHIAPHSGGSYSPIQAPFENINKFADKIDHIPRRMYAGVVDKLDESVGIVISELEKAGLLDNSIIVFTSDNGGAPEGYDNNQGSNWPLRGVKNTLWEGGTRIAGFIWSPLMLPSRVSTELMHVQDWLPTLYEAIGGDINKLHGIDGLSQWSTFKYAGSAVRHELLYNIDDIFNNSAIRVGPWKLIQGNTSPIALGATTRWDGWYGPSGRDPNVSIHDLIPLILSSKAGQVIREIGIVFNATAMKKMQEEADVHCNITMASNITMCNPYNTPCLFNVKNDPCELENMAEREPLILSDLLNKLEKYNRTTLPPNPKVWHPESNPKNWGYIWTNWED